MCDRKIKRVALFGAGPEIDFLAKNLIEEIDIVCFGADKRNIAQAADTIAFCKKNKIRIVESHHESDAFKPDLVVLMSYPTLLDKSYVDKFFVLNMHSTLLPSYRGLHGGTWAIINGDKYHGFSIHQVDNGIDTGPIYFQAKIEMAIEDNVLTLRKKIFELYKANIKSVILRILAGEVDPVMQDESKARHVCRRVPEDGLIDWNQSAWNIFNFIRALTPPYTPGAFTFWQGETLIIRDSELYPTPSYVSLCGQIVSRINGKGVLVKCLGGVLLIKNVIWKNREMLACDCFKTVGARLGAI